MDNTRDTQKLEADETYEQGPDETEAQKLLNENTAEANDTQNQELSAYMPVEIHTTNPSGQEVIH